MKDDTVLRKVIEHLIKKLNIYGPFNSDFDGKKALVLWQPCAALPSDTIKK